MSLQAGLACFRNLSKGRRRPAVGRTPAVERNRDCAVDKMCKICLRWHSATERAEAIVKEGPVCRRALLEKPDHAALRHSMGEIQREYVARPIDFPIYTKTWLFLEIENLRWKICSGRDC